MGYNLTLLYQFSCSNYSSFCCWEFSLVPLRPLPPPRPILWAGWLCCAVFPGLPPLAALQPVPGLTPAMSPGALVPPYQRRALEPRPGARCARAGDTVPLAHREGNRSLERLTDVPKVTCPSTAPSAHFSRRPHPSASLHLTVNLKPGAARSVAGRGDRRLQPPCSLWPVALPHASWGYC